MSESRYRRIYANEWHDPAFRRLNDGARVVRLYVSAGPQATSVGCFRLSSAVAVEDLGGTTEDFERRLENVCEALSWAWDSLARVIWITDWFERNPPANPNVVNAWAKLMQNVPDCPIKRQAISSINDRLKELPASFREPWRELSKSFPITESKAESKAQSRTETIQGSGIREFRSGEQRTGALPRDGGAERETLQRLVRETLTFTDERKLDHLVNKFHEVNPHITGYPDHAIKAAFLDELSGQRVTA